MRWRWTAVALMSSACAGGKGGGEAPPPQIGSTDAQTTSDATTRDATDESTTSGDFTTGGPAFTTGEMETTGATDPFATTTSSGGEQACSDPGTCNNAMVLGTVSGDESSPNLNAQGSDNAWFTFRVTENSEEFTGEMVSFTVTLTSPVGQDFDLYAFRGDENGTTGCGGIADDSTAAGAVDVVAMSWGEGGLADGDDESAWVAVRVESKTGVCDPTALWMLEVEGDT
jgi:hypothetical protein